MEEIWKDIPGYEGHYQVSNLGRVRRFYKNGKLHILTNLIDRGYEFVKLCLKKSYKKYRIHQLVAISFLDHVPCGLKFVVDHIDNNKSNNKVENLQILTNRINCTKNRKNKLGLTNVRQTKSGKYSSSIWHSGRHNHLGTFDSVDEAISAYNKALRLLQP